MIGQQRNRLAALGIGVWIPREVVCQKNTAPSLWRDQLIDDVSESTELTFEVAPILEDIPATSAHTPPITEIEVLHQTKVVTEPIAKAALVEKEQIVITAQIQSFELQMYVLENCAILLESSQLSDAQSQLWQNIQKARLGQYAELKWPFPLGCFSGKSGTLLVYSRFSGCNRNTKKDIVLRSIGFYSAF